MPYRIPVISTWTGGGWSIYQGEHSIEELLAYMKRVMVRNPNESEHIKWERYKENRKIKFLKEAEQILQHDPYHVQALVIWGLSNTGNNVDGNLWLTSARSKEDTTNETVFKYFERAFHQKAKPQPLTGETDVGFEIALMIAQYQVRLLNFSKAEKFYKIALQNPKSQQNDCIEMRLAAHVNPFSRGVEDAEKIMANYQRKMEKLLSKKNPSVHARNNTFGDPVRHCLYSMFYHEIYLDFDLKKNLSLQFQLQALAFPEFLYTSKFLQLEQTCSKRSKNLRKKIGVIYVDFNGSSVLLDFGYTLSRLSREKFEIVYISLNRGDKSKYLENRIKEGDQVLIIEEDVSGSAHIWLDPVREAIESLELDLLLYLDLTMSNDVLRILGMSRLARVQATTHGHPVTSGFDRSIINYYISWEAAEIPILKAQEHYTEKLILLPKTGMHQYNMRTVSPDRKFSLLTLLPFHQIKRKYFKKDISTSSGNWYTCMQKPFKLHPKFDLILSKIQKRDPNAQIILHDVASKHVRSIRRERFENAGIDMKRIHFVPSLQHHALLGLYNLSDVILDSYLAGGCTTTREALELGAVVVTLPAKYLGGRWSYAYYKQLGITDTIAKSEDDYVRLAVKYAIDKEARQELQQRTLQRVHRIFEQEHAVHAWEKVLDAITNKCI
eukprot:g1698.t1